MYSPIRRHIKKMKNTNAFDTRSSSGVRKGIENNKLKKKEEKKKIDKKLITLSLNTVSQKFKFIYILPGFNVAS